MKESFTVMIENFGLLDGAVQGTEIYLMSADEFTNWLAKASNAQQAWVTAQGFSSKPGKAITFAAVDGQIDFAIGIYGGHSVWDGASIAANLPIGQWQFVGHNSNLSNQSLESLALGWGLGQYRFHHYRATPPAPINCLIIPTGVHKRRLLSQLRGIYLCRDLINQPPNHMTPAAIEEAMVALAKPYKAILKTHSGKTLESGFPAIHTVGRAAEITPRLMDLRWGTTGPKITLIGKGITFDSGGLDLKPSKAMEMMKKDMGGAATVLGLAAARPRGAAAAERGPHHQTARRLRGSPLAGAKRSRPVEHAVVNRRAAGFRSCDSLSLFEVPAEGRRRGARRGLKRKLN